MKLTKVTAYAFITKTNIDAAVFTDYFLKKKYFAIHAKEMKVTFT